MSAKAAVSSDHELLRLLQIGVVLEEIVEARSLEHYRSLSEEERTIDQEVVELLEEAEEESAEHRRRLESLIDRLDAESVPFEEVEALVEERYGKTRPEDFDGILYDQLHGEESAYKFYDDVIGAIEESDAEFSIPREELVSTLSSIRAEEEEGVSEVTEVMGRLS